MLKEKQKKNKKQKTNSIRTELSALGDEEKHTMRPERLIKMLKPYIFSTFPLRWSLFGAQMLHHLVMSAEDGVTAELVSAGIFELPTELDECFNQKTEFFLSILECLLVGERRITTKWCYKIQSCMSNFR